MPKFRVAALIVSVTVLIGTLASLTWAGQRSAGQLPEGSRVAGVDVGGLSRDEAVQRVWRRLEKPTMRSVRVRAAGRSFVLSARRARVRLRLPETIGRAHAALSGESILERGWRELTGGRVDRDVRLRPSVSQRAIRKFVGEIRAAVHREAADARLSMSVTRVAATRERTGRRLVGGEALATRVARAFGNPQATRALRAETERVKPRVTRAQLWARTPVAVTVSRTDRRARLFRRGALVTSYRVAVGQSGYPTPTGRFTVQVMQENPTWNAPDSEWAGELAGRSIPPGDPRNPLVARWIGFDGAVGFHGTKSLESLGRAASRGCVRMSREDVISLYSRLEVGTPVIVGR